MSELDAPRHRAAEEALNRWTSAHYEKQVFSDLPDAAEACVRAYLDAVPGTTLVALTRTDLRRLLNPPTGMSPERRRREFYAAIRKLEAAL